MLTAGLLFHAPSPARAVVSLRLNSAGVISSPTSLSVDGLITSTGDWQDLKAAQVCITYDPAKVTLSNAQPGTGWNYEIAVDHADTHIFQALFTTQAVSLTSSGPVFTFTVTPVAGPVDTSDCTILKLRGGDGGRMWPVCELVSGDFYSVWIQDACPDDNALYLGDNYQRPDTGGMSMMGLMSEDPCDGPPAPLPPITAGMIQDTKDALKLAGGLSAGTPDRIGELDLTGDGKVTVEDAVCLLRTPKPEGWYEFQGNSQHTGYTPDPVSPTLTQIWKTGTGLPMPMGLTPVNAYGLTGLSISSPNEIPPSPVVIANPINPLFRLVYVAVPAKDVNGKYVSVVYRIEERPTESANPLITYARVPSDPNGPPFAVAGTPLVVGGKVVLAGNNDAYASPSSLADPTTGYVYALDATTLQPAWTGTSNPRVLPGQTFASPVYSPKVTEYTSQTCGVRTCVGGAVLIAAAGDPYATEGFLYALSLANGRNVWGKVDSDGGLVPDTPVLVDDPNGVFPGLPTSLGGLPPFGGPKPGDPTAYSTASPTNSSATVDTRGDMAFANDVSCYVNARGLRRGGYRWSQYYNYETVYATMSLFGGVLYYGGENRDMTAMRTDQSAEWYLDESSGIYAVRAGAAIEPNTGTVVVGDFNGLVFGLSNKSQQPPDPTIKWQPTVTTNGEPIYASALVAPNASGGSLAFVGGDDNLVHVLGISSTGGSTVTALGTLGDSTNLNRTFDGPVRASLAGMDGRAYVLIHGHVQDDGTVDYPTKVYCFGTP